MKDYHQRKNEIDAERFSKTWGDTEHGDGFDARYAKLNDEKRVFDLRFEAACQFYAAMIACPLSDVVVSISDALTSADRLLELMGVTE